MQVRIDRSSTYTTPFFFNGTNRNNSVQCKKGNLLCCLGYSHVIKFYAPLGIILGILNKGAYAHLYVNFWSFCIMAYVSNLDEHQGIVFHNGIREYFFKNKYIRYNVYHNYI